MTLSETLSETRFFTRAVHINKGRMDGVFIRRRNIDRNTGADRK